MTGKLPERLWLRSFTHKGYGRYASKRAHRVAYEILVGPIPEGKETTYVGTFLV